jgi:hypothetical protein
MWAAEVVCSSPECGELQEVFVESLDELEWVVCECECAVVVLSIAGFEALRPTGADGQ